MTPKLSPLCLLDFAILNARFKHTAVDENTDITTLVNQYNFDIDFAIVNQSDQYRLFVKVSINEGGEKRLPGYSIFAEGVAIFKFENNEISDEDKASLLNYSGISITLNNLRGVISSLTAFAPFGRFILPSIDVIDLLQQKAQSALQTSK
jgi:preprotein translocase subunit SecB